MKINRIIKKQLIKSIIPGRATILLGARQVGKTTLIKEILNEKTTLKTAFFNCDDPDVKEQFTNINIHNLKRILAPFELVIFDEAQRIRNIGLILKMIIDELAEKKLLVSGSSSLELSNEINEPLTGRKHTLYLYPISFRELFEHEENNEVTARAYIEQILLFGSYPKTFSLNNESQKQAYLLELAHDYLYKDVLEYQKVKNPDQLKRLLSALALQIGQEVSLPELGSLVGVDHKTVVRYLDLLEKSFVVFRLPAFSRNMRKEIAKSRKIYFWDLGIRNAIIRNFNSFDLRADLGQVWENFLIAERLKRDRYLNQFKNYYFWRTYDRKEIDLVEEYGGKLHAFEFKWQKSKIKPPQDFLTAYSGSEFKLVNQDNFFEFVI